jgi:hypothetical protein
MAMGSRNSHSSKRWQHWRGPDAELVEVDEWRGTDYNLGAVVVAGDGNGIVVVILSSSAHPGRGG